MNNICDKIYCIHFKPYTDRIEPLKQELQRAGIDVQFVFTEDHGKDPVEQASDGHLECIRDALKNNYKKIIIMEDDIRFLKNINKVNEYFKNFPEDADIVLFDYIIHAPRKQQKEIIAKLRGRNKYFFKYNTQIFWSAACYFLSEKGMKHILINQENNRLPPDHYTSYLSKSIDREVDLKLNRYLPCECLCIQKIYANNIRTRRNGSDNSYIRYWNQNTNIKNYNI